MTTLTKRQISYYINSVICIALMVFFRFIPPFAGITELGMAVLGIFLGAIYGWVSVGFIWPSLLAMILLGLTDYGTISTVFSEGFGHYMPIQIILTFILFKAFEKSGFINYMANWLLGLKINQGRPWLLTFWIFFASGILSAFTSQFAVIVLLWFIVYGISAKIGMDKTNSYIAYTIVGIACFAELTIIMFPFCPVSVLVLGIIQQSIGVVEIPALGWSVVGLIIMLISIIFYLLAGKYLLKIDVSPLLEKDVFKEMRGQKITHSEKIGAVYLCLFVLIIVLPTVLPKTWIITGILSNLGITGACAICLVGLCFTINESGENKLSFSQLAKDGMAWEMYILVLSTMPICNAMESTDTGITAAITNVLTSALGSMTPMVFVIVVVVVFALLSQFTHNLVLMIVFLPIIAKLCISFGIDPIACAFLYVFGLNTAMGTPGGSAASAMLFGNTEWVSRSACYKNVIVWVVGAILTIVVVGYPLSTILM